jgi:esterase/lipase superfamily enzyme
MSRVRWLVVTIGLSSLLLAADPHSVRAQTAATEGDPVLSTPIPPEAEIGAQPSAELPAPAAGAAPVVADAATMTVYFATNRNPVPHVTQPEQFGNNLGNTTLFGRVVLRQDGATWSIEDIAVEGGNVNRALAAPELLAGTAPAAGVTPPEVLGIDPTGPLATFAAEATAPTSDVIAFVHGAGHSFESAVIDAARLARLYGREGHPVIPLVFSYPSNGHSTVTGYFADRRDAGMSGLAMAEGFRRMLSFLAEVRERRPLGRQALIVHSLGAFATRQAVQAIKSGGLPDKKVFDVVMIMAGDEDADTLSSDDKLRPLIDLSDAAVAYFAGNDFLMQLSTIANLRRPIGREGPKDLAVEDFGDLQVHAVDAAVFSAVGDRIRAHSYFLRSPRVIADAKVVFAGAEPDAITGRRKVSDRLYRLVADQVPELAAAAAAGAAESSSEVRVYVFTGDPQAEQPIIELTGSNSREIALSAAGQVESGGEILPGRFDEVLVLPPSSATAASPPPDAAGVIVQIPSKAFLDTVLPRGFVSESSPALAAPGGVESGTVRLQVAPGLTIVAEPIRSALEQTLGFTTWSGRVVATIGAGGEPEPATGSVSLIYDESGVSGTLTVNDKIFEIEAIERPATLSPAEGAGAAGPAGLSRVEDVTGEPILGDESPREGEDDGDPSLELPDDQRGAIETTDDRAAPEAAAAAVPVVDVLLVFTEDATRKVGNVRRAAAEYVERSNLSLEISKIPGRLKAVSAETIAGTESGNGQTDLNRLRAKTDGHFDTVHGRREALAADGVALIVASSNVAGFAGSNVAANDAFLVVRSDHAGRHFSLIHEIGHWAGATHARGANVPSFGWASVMKHMPDSACPPGGTSGACRRDGLWTDAPRTHPNHGFQLGASSASNAPRLRAASGLAKFSQFR